MPVAHKQKKKNNGLTDKQERFCQEYILDFKSGQAYRRAGYKASNDNVAHANAGALLLNHKVQSRIKELVDERKERLQYTLDDVVNHLFKMFFFDTGKLHNPDGTLKTPNEWDEETRQIVEGYEVFEEYAGTGKNKTLVGYTKKANMPSRTKTADMLIRHLGGYNNDQSQRPNVNIQNNVNSIEVSDEQRARAILTVLSRIGIDTSILTRLGKRDSEQMGEQSNRRNGSVLVEARTDNDSGGDGGGPVANGTSPFV